MFSLMYLGYLILILETLVVAVLVFPYIPVKAKKFFSDLLKKFFDNKYSSYVVSVLAAVFILLFFQNMSTARIYSRRPPIVPGVPPPPPNPEHIHLKYASQRNAYIFFFNIYFLMVIWSLMKLFVTYNLDKVPPPLPPKPAEEKKNE